MTHFVYVYIKQGVMWDELMYSIMSIRKFFNGEHKIFVVGDRPGIPGVSHIPVARVHGGRNPKAQDSIAKLQLIADNKQINEDFVYMYDDIVLLKPCTEEDLKVTRAIDYVPKPGTYFSPRARPSKTWINLWLRTMITLQKEGLPTWNYETHLPRWYNKTNVSSIIQRFNLKNDPMLFASLYYNTLNLAPYEALVTSQTIKAGVYEPHEPLWIQRNVNGKLFLNYDNAGLNEHLRRYIKNLLK